MIRAAHGRKDGSTSGSLLARLRQDDAGAWERLVTLYAPMVHYWCRCWNLPQQDFADIFQEVFQAVASHIADFRKRSPHDSFRAWLRTITRNKIHDHFRRQRRQPQGMGGSEGIVYLSQVPAPTVLDEGPGEDEDDDDREDHETEEAAELGLFHRALELIRGDFREKTWQAFWRTAVDGRAPKDVAADLEMTPGAVRVAKSRVLHRLRDELGELME